MQRQELTELVLFAAVSRTSSFTKASVTVGVSPSALSRSIRSLEARLGVRLLTRTTRSVALTEAGEHLMGTLGPAFNDIDVALADLVAMRSRPAGTIRLTTVKHAATTFLWPLLAAFAKAHPDIRVELVADDGLANIVADGFDAGIRLGERVDKDMIAVRISPAIPTAVVATPAYFARHPMPSTPADLVQHDCIGHRMKTGGLYPWPFEQVGRSLVVKVSGTLVCSDSDLLLRAALAGQGLAYLFADQVAAHLKSGELVSTLDDWCVVHPGYYLYYANRRLQPPALAALIDAFRTRESTDRIT